MRSKSVIVPVLQKRLRAASCLVYAIILSMINPNIESYIEKIIIPRYRAMLGHTEDHIRQVIARSLNFAKTLDDINLDMVYVIAAYHDLGREIDNEHHEIESGKMLRADQELKKYFSPDQIEIMAEAVEDHRASLKREPRSIYGKIVSSADRNTDVNIMLKRVYHYTKLLNPDKTEDEIIEIARQHLRKKYSPDGYAAEKMYFDDPNFKACLIKIEQITRDPAEFRKLYKNKTML